ncbi:acyltransferase family protein [Amnibacterium sp. CER49]|uniref:acyltransferase family protein n=1 Tax=Amnibacterium sp. CER49 TaxID=3039161 RepID=UPI00244869A8|nr:acyltransferase family protein [Amnibacterium sp. CER49]MDH2443790.1 acyltransferase family protein [Amnibacterium sp. CER49]
MQPTDTLSRPATPARGAAPSDAAVAGTEPAAERPRPLRLEVQTLRAIAVTLVVVYHLRPASLPGGYVGVDVFFVISGFLISGHLLREAESTGGVSLTGFWANRVRRILPAALATVAVVTVTASIALPRTAAAEVGRAAVWSALSAANWLFAAQSVDYQAQSPDASPFEHFWSLGVEEQFYLLWPLLVLGLALLARRRAALIRRWAPLPFGLVLVASLAYGVWLTASGSEAAYFITPTRMWELAAGGLLAALLGERRLPPAAAAVVQAGGVGAILTAAMVFTAATPMPGWAAALPVLGALAVIAGGDAPVLRRVWALRPVRFVGDVSYSLYLWHWPLLVFSRALTGHAPGRLQSAALVLGALGLAFLSYRFIEQPFRRARIRRPLRFVSAGLVAALVAASLGGALVLRDRIAADADAAAGRVVLTPSAGAPIGWPALDAAADRTWVRPQHVTVPEPAQAGNDIPFPRCTTGHLDPRSPVCVLGDPRGDVTVAFVGDSHAVMWSGAMDLLAKQEHWRLLTLMHNSCPFNLRPREMERSGHSNCTTAVRYGMEVLRSRHVRVVLTTGWRGDFPREVRGAADGYSSLWRTLQQEGMAVVALGDTPAPPSATGGTIPDCVAAHDPATCGRSRKAAESFQPDPLLRAAAETPGVGVLDPVDAFCGTTWCPGVIGNVLVYRDLNHITDTYARTTVPWLRRHLAPIVQQRLAGATS